MTLVAGLHYASPGVDQTTFATDPFGGNCLAAVVATIVQEPIEAVPHFALFGALWTRAVNLFLLQWALTAERIDLDDLDGLSIAVGPSERGVKHCVLHADGVMVHDPHPSRAGLVKIEQRIGVWGDVYAALYDRTDASAKCHFLCDGERHDISCHRSRQGSQ